MSKLTLDALKDRAESVASEDLLLSISGGTENACHDGGSQRHPLNQQYQDTGGRNPLSPVGQWLADWLWNRNDE